MNKTQTTEGLLMDGVINHVAATHILCRMNGGHNFTANVHPTAGQLGQLKKGDTILLRGFIRESESDNGTGKRTFININGATQVVDDKRYEAMVKIAVLRDGEWVTIDIDANEEDFREIVTKATAPADAEVPF